MLKITVKYFAAIKEKVGKQEEEISLDYKMSLKELIEFLKSKNGEEFSKYLNKNKDRVTVLVNGKNVGFKEFANFKIKDNDVIAILPPVAGGSNKIHLEAHGCTASFADAEMILGLLKSSGFEIVKDSKDANINIIVTCTVKTPTSQRMAYKIRKLTSLGKPLIVAGCMPKTEREIIESINPKASLVGPEQIHKIVEAVNLTLKGEKVEFVNSDKVPKLLFPRVRENPVVAKVEIASGCLANCAFCQVKVAKGNLLSYPPELIIKEVKNSLKEGCKEIWLTSTDCGCYGLDIGYNIGKIVKDVASIDGEFWIRIGMMNPFYLKGNVLDDLIEAYSSDKVFKFAHLPVQSGSNKVLRDMNRNYTVEKYLEIVDKLRSNYPEITIATDIIVGYPTENENDFDKTINLLKELKPDTINLSKFGARPKTLASKLPQLNNKIIKRRSIITYELIKEIMKKKNDEWIGWEGYALVDEVVRGAMMARNKYYKPIIIKENVRLGDKVKVRINSSSMACLFGNIIKEVKV